MTDGSVAELGRIQTSNYVSFYPLAPHERSFSPLMQDLRRQIHPYMKRKDIHEFMRGKIKEYGPETMEGRFLDKVFHFALVQEALAFLENKSLEVPFHPLPYDTLVGHLNKFETCFKMNVQQKKIFDTVINKIETNLADLYPHHKGKMDFRKKLGDLVIGTINGQDNDLESELSDFIRGMIMLRSAMLESFPRLFKEIAEEKIAPEKRKILSDFFDTQEVKDVMFVYQYLQAIKNEPKISNDPESCNTLKASLWETMNKVTMLNNRKNHHPPISAGDRLETHNEWKIGKRAAFSKIPEASEDFSFKGGDYSSVEVIRYDSDDTKYIQARHKLTASQQELNRNPYGAENFMVNRIKQMMKQGKHKPIIFVDFGSQCARSTLRLAELFQEEVKNGYLIFVASNILDDFSKIKATYHKDPYKTWAWFDRVAPLVQFVQADAQDLQNLQVKTVDGGNIPLKGNVSLIHELGSISRFGTMNDIDFPLLSNTLNSDGIIMTHRVAEDNYPIDSHVGRRLQKMQLKAEKRPVLPEKAASVLSQKWGLENPPINASDIARADRAMRAFNNLHGLGFKLIDEIPDINSSVSGDKNRKIELNYAFWMKPTALPLQLQNFDGKWIDISPASMN